MDSSIIDYINSHRFDDITSPTWGVDPHPRLEIWNNIHTREDLQERFRNLGMELLWVDIGHFDVSDDIWRWRVRTWGANWAGTALLQRSRGRVRRLTYDRLARAEGRADALELIINQLNDARLSGTSADNLRNLVFLYTAEILNELGQARETWLPGMMNNRLVCHKRKRTEPITGGKLTENYARLSVLLRKNGFIRLTEWPE